MLEEVFVSQFLLRKQLNKNLFSMVHEIEPGHYQKKQNFKISRFSFFKQKINSHKFLHLDQLSNKILNLNTLNAETFADVKIFANEPYEKILQALLFAQKFNLKILRVRPQIYFFIIKPYAKIGIKINHFLELLKNCMIKKKE